MSDDDSEIIFGGEWPPVEEVRPIEGKVRKVEDTRATLAFCLFGLLAGTILLLLVLLAFGRLRQDEFAQVAGLLIAPLVGLVGSVTGYYYGRTDRR